MINFGALRCTTQPVQYLCPHVEQKGTSPIVVLRRRGGQQAQRIVEQASAKQVKAEIEPLLVLLREAAVYKPSAEDVERIASACGLKQKGSFGVAAKLAQNNRFQVARIQIIGFSP